MKINITTPDAGGITSAVNENTILTELNTGTSNLDAENIRDEGIAEENLNTTVISAHGEVEWKPGGVVTYQNGYDKAGGGIGDGRNIETNLRIDWSATPVTVHDGDYIRIEWSFYHVSWESSVAGEDDRLCWVTTPLWDITDNTLTTFERLPGHGYFGRWWSNHFGSPTSLSSGIAVIPVNSLADSAGARGGSFSVEHMQNNVHGLYLRHQSGGDITIYGLELMIAGPFVYYHYNDGAGTEDDVYDPVHSSKQDLNGQGGMLAITVFKG